MRSLLAAALILLLSVSAGLAHDSAASQSVTEVWTPDILWQIRSPGAIDLIGRRAGLGPGVGGLAWSERTPCGVMTPIPPLPDEAYLKIRNWLRLMHHELRHCREGNFHQGETRQ